MNTSHLIQFPLTNPVLIFAIVLIVILLSPIVLRKFKIPGLVGLILSGMILGPNGFNILARDSSIILFGTVGLLYIMFTAGLELDYNVFNKNKNKSMTFGFLTFIIPLVLGFLVCYYILKLDILASLLVASMFSTHTLVSYPITSRLGILKNDVIGIAVGGTIFTDTAVLILLAVITKAYTGELSLWFWGQLIISLTIFLGIVLYIFPKISKWFFRNVESESVWQYIFVLALLFIAAFLAELAGVEPIIGAFIAGLALNRLIPHNSALMDKIDFVGNAIFIPFFLISVGMIVDLRVLAKGTESIIFAITLSVVAIATKYIAAHLTGSIYKYSKDQNNLLWGLTTSHAAATLAIILVGFNIGLLNEYVLNGTIILILLTCIISSFATEHYGRKIALNNDENDVPVEYKSQRILVPIANPDNINKLMEFAQNIKDPSSNEMIYSLMVFNNESELNDKIKKTQNLIKSVTHSISPKLNDKVQLTSRIDISPSSGILRASKELLITDLVIGMSNRGFLSDFLFGNIVQNVVDENHQNIFIIKITVPLNTMDKIFVFIPENSENEIGFKNVILTICRFSNTIGAMIIFCCFERTSKFVRNIMKLYKITVTASFEIAESINDFDKFHNWIEDDDMMFFVSSRSKGISFNNQFDKFMHDITDNNMNNNLVLVYPEQNPIIETESYTRFDILDSSSVGESINIIDKIKKLFKR